MLQDKTPVAVVRGGGDIATGVVQKLWRGGFLPLVLETMRPTAIRRTVSLSTAVDTGEYTVEDMRAVLVPDAAACAGVWKSGGIPVLVDPTCALAPATRPLVLVDAIMAKRNLGTRAGMAPVVVALGPGFTAPADADAVIETMRGHDLGRLIFDGAPLPDTGVPGLLGGKTAERVVHAPCAGTVCHTAKIGDRVKTGDIIFTLDGVPVPSQLDGTLRGLIAEGLPVSKGMKCADVDPRPADEVDVGTISDKARCIGGAVLEACLLLGRRKGILQLTPAQQ